MTDRDEPKYMLLPDGTVAEVVSLEDHEDMLRRKRHRENMARIRRQTDPVDRAAELAKRREQRRWARMNETDEEREVRRARDRERQARRRGATIAKATKPSMPSGPAPAVVTSQVTQAADATKRALHTAFYACIAELREHGLNSAQGRASLKTLLSACKQHLDT